MSDADFLVPELLGGPPVDLTNCEREPIHIPGSVQPHGVLLVLHGSDLRTVQVSRNAAQHLGIAVGALLGRPLATLAEARDVEALQRFLQGVTGPLFTLPLRFQNGATFDATVHTAGSLVMLELEPPDERSSSASFFHEAKLALASLEAAQSVQALCDAAAEQVRELTGFDRVMIYRFDEDGHGQVVAEAQRGDLQSYLGLHFPESDIPRQARALYLRNLLRLTADVQAAPAPLEPLLNPLTGAPLDMSRVVLRSTSPMHVQYLKNMGVASSLSVSIVQEGRLWGLVSCHHLSAKYVPHATRAALEFLGRVLALQLTAKRETEEALRRAELKAVAVRLANDITHSERPLQALRQRPDLLLDFVQASGASVSLNGVSGQFGVTPGAEDVRALIAWLSARDAVVFNTNALPQHLPAAVEIEGIACGLLAINLSGDWSEHILWFRPEVTQTIAWGGNPNKPVEVDGQDGETVLTPRASFETFIETVRHTALPWRPAEVSAAGELRGMLIEAVAARAAALQEVNARLTRVNQELSRSSAELKQFAYITSHDLQEPLRQVSSFVELLQRRYGAVLDDDGKAYVGYAVEGANRLRAIIADLHVYLEIGTHSHKDSAFSAVDLSTVLRSTLPALRPMIEAQQAVIEADSLPTVQGSAERLGQVLLHLLHNALKFRGVDAPRVRVSARREGASWVIGVHDNGIGIKPEYVSHVFTVFKRLNRREDYAGNGIGLGVTRKIIERHGGRLWVESEYGKGSSFYFTLPAAGG